MGANIDLFNEAISLHQNKKYDEAQAAYINLLDVSHDLNFEQASVASHNLSVLFFQKGDTPLAYVFNKKSLSLDSNNLQAKQFLTQQLKNYKINEIPRDLSTLEQVNSFGIKYIYIEIAMLATLILFLILLKIIFNFIIEYKKSITELKLRPLLNWKFYAYLTLFLFSFTILGLKKAELNQNLGIIKSTISSVATAAGDQQAIITEVASGQVVQILQTKQINGIFYTQVKVPGAFSGWVKKADLVMLNSIN